MRHNIIMILGFLLFIGCGEKATVVGDVVGDATSGAITVSGILVAGDQVAASQLVSRLLVPRASGDPLVGYQLYCVTFATPPTAATGTADETGLVTLDLDAQGIPFGCFVLDTGNIAVATVIFSNGGEQGQTVTLTGDTDLGGITVDLDNGVAQTDITLTGTLTGSQGLACPLGTWVTDVSMPDCENSTSTIWVTQEIDGQYTVSFTVGPMVMTTGGKCVYNSKVGLPATMADGELTFSFEHAPGYCPSRMITIALTPDADCSELSVVGSFGPCISCEKDECGCEEGSLTCTQNYTMVRD